MWRDYFGRGYLEELGALRLFETVGIELYTFHFLQNTRCPLVPCPNAAPMAISDVHIFHHNRFKVHQSSELIVYVTYDIELEPFPVFTSPTIISFEHQREQKRPLFPITVLIKMQSDDFKLAQRIRNARYWNVPIAWQRPHPACSLSHEGVPQLAINPRSDVRPYSPGMDNHILLHRPRRTMAPEECESFKDRPRRISIEGLY